MKSVRNVHIWILVLLASACGDLRAQWLTQNFVLKPGWNAIFTHVDASYTDLGLLLQQDADNPILEVWLWNLDPDRFQFSSLGAASAPGSQWAVWRKADLPGSNLSKLYGNAAFLVRVDEGRTGPYNWQVKGKPVLPRYRWTTKGVNLVGFSTVAETPPRFDSFLRWAPALNQNASIYQYVGGSLGAQNPAQILSKANTSVARGQAFWIDSKDAFNRYFGPFDLEPQDGKGINFGASGGQSQVVIKNGVSTNLEVTVSLIQSEEPPAGQPSVKPIPTLLVRGELNLTNLTYGYTRLDSQQKLNLAPKGSPGGDLQVVLGLDRARLNAQPGDLYAAVLRFTDNLHFTQFDIPITAETISMAGLWVGRAMVTQVRSDLRSFQKDSDGNTVLDAAGGAVATSTNTNFGAVSRAFPLRLIIHQDKDQNARLLQRAFVGLGAGTNLIVSTSELAFPSTNRVSIRRISAIHLPWREGNSPLPMTGSLETGVLSREVYVDFSADPTNPFVHTFHPDHDNLDAEYKKPLPQGEESYSIQREITLTLQSATPDSDFATLTEGAETVSGIYSEVLTLLGKAIPNAATALYESKTYEVRGAFALNRISTVDILTQ